MPTYDYECEVCEYQQEEVHSMMDKPPVNCEVCGAPCKKVILVAPGGGVVNTTLGSLADKNRDSMSEDEFQSKVEEQRTKKLPGMEVPEGMERTPNKPVREKQWYDKHTTKTVQEVAQLTPEKTKEYIVNGK
jgi:putative FmdB family regulatory protein